MCFHNFLYNCLEFLLFCLIYSIFSVDTCDRTVGRNLDNVHAVDITELFFLCQGCTCHTCFLCIFIEEVLECNGCKRLALTFYFYMLFCLNCLMKSVRITTSRHNTSGKLINDQDFIIRNYIILITVHQVMCTQCKDDIVLDLKILSICKVVNLEKFLDFFHTFLCQVDDFIFLIYDEITGFLDFNTHDGIHFGKFLTCLTTFHLFCQNVTCLIQLGGFAALSGNDQRCTCLIDQYRVNLIDDGIVQITLYQLLLVDNHIVTQIIETKFIIGNIRNITLICFLTFIMIHIIQNHAYGQSQELMYFSHPFSITFCQVIIDGNDMNTFSFQCIQICRRCGNKCLTFTGLHLCDTSLMKNDTTDELYPVMLHAKHTFCSFTDSCKSFRKKIVQSFSFCKSFFIFFCFTTQLLIRQCLHLRTITFDFIRDRIN